jgi:hypothetical protein
MPHLSFSPKIFKRVDANKRCPINKRIVTQNLKINEKEVLK